MRASILVPALNEEQSLLRLLPSLVNTVELCPAIAEVLLISSPSMDRTEAICATAAQRWGFIRHIKLANWSPKLHVIAYGASLSSNEWVLLLDADIQVQPETLCALASRADSGPAIIQARNMPDCLNQFHTDGDIPPRILIWAAVNSLAWHWLRLHRPDLRWALSGQCLLCHRNLIPSDSQALSVDDVSIGLHCAKLGYPITYSPADIVVYKPAQNWLDFVRQKLRTRIGLARLRAIEPERISSLRKALRGCLRDHSCLEGMLPKKYWQSANTFLQCDTVLWTMAKNMAACGFGARGRWRAARSTKM